MSTALAARRAKRPALQAGRDQPCPQGRTAPRASPGLCAYRRRARPARIAETTSSARLRVATSTPRWSTRPRASSTPRGRRTIRRYRPDPQDQAQCAMRSAFVHFRIPTASPGRSTRTWDSQRLPCFRRAATAMRTSSPRPPPSPIANAAERAVQRGGPADWRAHRHDRLCARVLPGLNGVRPILVNGVPTGTTIMRTDRSDDNRLKNTGVTAAPRSSSMSPSARSSSPACKRVLHGRPLVRDRLGGRHAHPRDGDDGADGTMRYPTRETKSSRTGRRNTGTPPLVGCACALNTTTNR